MLNKIIEKAKKIGFDDVQIMVVENCESELSLFHGAVEKNFVGNEATYYLKGIINNKLSTFVFGKDSRDFTDDEIDSILLKLKENVLTINSKDEFSIYEGSKEYPVIKKKENDLDSFTLDAKINLLKEMEKDCYDFDPRVELVQLELNEATKKVTIVNSKGLNLTDVNRYYVVVGECVCGKTKDDPKKVQNFDVFIGIKQSDFNKNEFVKKFISDALKKLGGEPVESKEYPILMDKKAMSGLLAGFFSMFSGEALLRGLTGLKGKLNEKVMSELITITDDPLDENSYSQSAFDLEGVACFKKNVVEKGVFKMFLHNLKTAKAFGTTSTGNASMSSVTGMNFHIANGTTKYEEVLSSIKEGLLIKSLQGLHAGLNPISGDFSAQASGFLIKDGKIDRPVTLIVVSGNFLKMLNDVKYVADDFEYSYTGFGSPSILYNGLPVSGK